MHRETKSVLQCLGIGLIVFAVAIPATAEETLWNIKAIHPSGSVLDVKAVDDEGNKYDIKAIEEPGNPHMLDIKAFVDGKRVPVKVVVTEERFAPIQALPPDGRRLDVVAFTSEGKQLPVRGVRRFGSIVHIKAMAMSRFYAVKAISADGRLYDVKGVKMTNANTESVIGPVKIHAHVKALPPTSRPDPVEQP